MGAMTYYTKINQFDKAIQWRLKAKQVLEPLGFKVFDPTINFTENIQYPSKGVLYQNLHYLNKSKFVLGNIQFLEHSPGSLYELFTAFNDHKPVITFGYSDVLTQPHVNEAITVNFVNLDLALEYIRNMYGQ
jgi:hypothetical protein